MSSSVKRSCIAFACFLVAVSPSFAQLYEIVDLGTLGGAYSYATGITDSGVISGWATTTSGGKRPVLWIDGVIQDLGAPPFGGGEAMGVNSAGPE